MRGFCGWIADGSGVFGIASRVDGLGNRIAVWAGWRFDGHVLRGSQLIGFQWFFQSSLFLRFVFHGILHCAIFKEIIAADNYYYALDNRGCDYVLFILA
jgi:hypothetical protein